MREACRKLDILFVADEVITGFGRTGPLFACEAEGVEPDLMTVAKGLTAGYVPMGAVLMSDAVYQGIADGGDAAAAIGHGDTYSAHPVSAAVGLEVLRLYHEGGLLANGTRVAPRFAPGSMRCSRIRWSAMRGIAACSARSNSCRTRTSKQGFDPALEAAGPDRRGRVSQRPRVPRVRRQHPRLRAGALLHGRRVRHDVRAPRKDARRRARAARRARRAGVRQRGAARAA